MAATVLTGTLVQGTTFSYTNNTGGNVRFMIYYMHTGWTDGNSASGTFGWGAASGNGQMEMDLFEGTSIGKYIANAATPNFKARDMDFEVELARALSVGPMKTSNNSHITLASKNLPGKVQYRKPLHPSMDGNTVELAVEQTEFAENAMRYQTTLNFINSKLSGLVSAIRGE